MEFTAPALIFILILFFIFFPSPAVRGEKEYEEENENEGADMGVGIGRFSPPTYGTISVPMPVLVKISTSSECGVRPSMKCTFLTPCESA